MKTEIMPEVGVEYQLFDGESEKSQSSFTGIYIGKNPTTETASWGLSALGVPEGHVFIRRNRSRVAEIFYTGTSESKLTLSWYSDGDDGPEWPAGFLVSKLDDQYISGQVRGYLQERLGKFERERRVA